MTYLNKYLANLGLNKVCLSLDRLFGRNDVMLENVNFRLDIRQKFFL